MMDRADSALLIICLVGFRPISSIPHQITRTYEWENFLKSSPLLEKTVQYQFEPLEGDEVSVSVYFYPSFESTGIDFLSVSRLTPVDECLHLSTGVIAF